MLFKELKDALQNKNINKKANFKKQIKKTKGQYIAEKNKAGWEKLQVGLNSCFEVVGASLMSMDDCSTGWGQR